MKEKDIFKKLGITIISVILSILIIRFCFWILGCIAINLLSLPITFTYSTSIGIVVLLFLIRGIVKLFVEGIDNIKFHSSKEEKTYKYKVVYKNSHETNGNITGSSIDEVIDVFLDNKVNLLNQGKKGFYFNRDEIQYLQIEEIEE